MNIQSLRNVTLSARDANNKLTGQIHLGNEEVVMKSKSMRILDESGKSLLYADKDKLEMNVKVAEFIGTSILILLQFTKTLINQIAG